MHDSSSLFLYNKRINFKTNFEWEKKAVNVHVCWIVLLLASRWIGCNVAAAPVGWWADTSAPHCAYACSRGLWRSEEISDVSQVMHETDRTSEITSSVYCVKKLEKQLLSKPRHWKTSFILES